MGRKLFKQPNGRYGCYSTNVDGFIFCNATKEDYIEMRLNELKDDLEEMFAREETDPWKGTVHANILDADTMFEEISYYNWDENDLVKNMCMLLSAGYSREKINELESKWNNFQKEIEDEENGE